MSKNDKGPNNLQEALDKANALNKEFDKEHGEEFKEWKNPSSHNKDDNLDKELAAMEKELNSSKKNESTNGHTKIKLDKTDDLINHYKEKTQKDVGKAVDVHLSAKDKTPNKKPGFFSKLKNLFKGSPPVHKHGAESHKQTTQTKPSPTHHHQAPSKEQQKLDDARNYLKADTMKLAVLTHKLSGKEMNDKEVKELETKFKAIDQMPMNKIDQLSQITKDTVEKTNKSLEVKDRTTALQGHVTNVSKVIATASKDMQTKRQDLNEKQKNRNQGHGR